MQVYKLAKELGVEAKEMAKFLGKATHLAVASDEDQAKARAEYAGNGGDGAIETVPEKGSEIPAANEVSGKPEGKPDDVIVYISLKRRYKLETPEGVIEFDEFRFPTKKGSAADKYISRVAARVPELYVLETGGFDDDAKRAEFRGLLEEQCLDSQQQLKPDYGYAFLLAMFNLAERREATGIIMRSADEAIERVLRTKKLVKAGAK